MKNEVEKKCDLQDIGSSKNFEKRLSNSSHYKMVESTTDNSKKIENVVVISPKQKLNKPVEKTEKPKKRNYFCKAFSKFCSCKCKIKEKLLCFRKNCINCDINGDSNLGKNDKNQNEKDEELRKK